VVLWGDRTGGKLGFDFGFGEGAKLLVIVVDIILHEFLLVRRNEAGRKTGTGHAERFIFSGHKISEEW